MQPEPEQRSSRLTRAPREVLARSSKWVRGISPERDDSTSRQNGSNAPSENPSCPDTGSGLPGPPHVKVRKTGAPCHLALQRREERAQGDHVRDVPALLAFKRILVTRSDRRKASSTVDPRARTRESAPAVRIASGLLVLDDVAARWASRWRSSPSNCSLGMDSAATAITAARCPRPRAARPHRPEREHPRGSRRELLQPPATADRHDQDQGGDECEGDAAPAKRASSRSPELRAEHQAERHQGGERAEPQRAPALLQSRGHSLEGSPG